MRPLLGCVAVKETRETLHEANEAFRLLGVQQESRRSPGQAGRAPLSADLAAAL